MLISCWWARLAPRASTRADLDPASRIGGTGQKRLPRKTGRIAIGQRCCDAQRMHHQSAGAR
jgi:hypothetical protein